MLIELIELLKQAQWIIERSITVMRSFKSFESDTLLKF